MRFSIYSTKQWLSIFTILGSNHNFEFNTCLTSINFDRVSQNYWKWNKYLIKDEESFNFLFWEMKIGVLYYYIRDTCTYPKTRIRETIRIFNIKFTKKLELRDLQVSVIKRDPKLLLTRFGRKVSFWLGFSPKKSYCFYAMRMKVLAHPRRHH